MVNTNKIIDYLTQKNQFLDKTSRSAKCLMQHALDLDTVGRELDRKVVSQPRRLLGTVKDICSEQWDRPLESDVSTPNSENLVLGSSVTSFYMPSRI